MTREVGVYEAKTHLSQLLDQVADGAVITITRSGKSAAVLAPVPQANTLEPRRFGIWPDYVVPDGWDDFTSQDEKLWYTE